MTVDLSLRNCTAVRQVVGHIMPGSISPDAGLKVFVVNHPGCKLLLLIFILVK